MKVKDLIRMLSGFDPEAEILEENRSEVRRLDTYDVQFLPTEDDRHIETDDGEIVRGPVVLFRAWD